jgi:hypothetical protein
MQDLQLDLILAGIAGLSIAGIVGIELAKRRRPKPRLRLPVFRWPAPIPFLP